MPTVSAPRALQYRNAVSVSAVSPDCTSAENMLHAVIWHVHLADEEARIVAKDGAVAVHKVTGNLYHHRDAGRLAVQNKPISATKAMVMGHV